MNAKKCKAFRKRARDETKGLPERQWVAKVHNKLVIIDGKEEKYQRAQALNDPNTTRGRYRLLKKGKVK